MLCYQCVYRRKQLNSSHSHQRLRLETRKRNRLKINTLPNVNLRLLHSYPLGMTCQLTTAAQQRALRLSYTEADEPTGEARSVLCWGTSQMTPRMHPFNLSSHAVCFRNRRTGKEPKRSAAVCSYNPCCDGVGFVLMTITAPLGQSSAY
jgi:hypothetical protein